MDIDNLKTFLKVVETRSFSRSAEEMKLTQPAVSKRIAALESRLGARLFDRVGRTVHLTEAGRLLLPGAKQIQSELMRIEDTILHTGDSIAGNLSVGSTAQVTTSRLASLLKDFGEKFAEVDLNLHIDKSESILESVSDNTLELAICSVYKDSLSHLSQNLRCTELWSEDLNIVVNNSSPLAMAEKVSLLQLMETPAILPSPKSLASKSIHRQLAALSVDPIVSVYADEFSAMRTLASIGLGWTCLPTEEIDNTLTVLSVDGLKFSRTTILVRRRGYSLSKAAEAFVGSLPVNSQANQLSNQGFQVAV